MYQDGGGDIFFLLYFVFYKFMGSYVPLCLREYRLKIGTPWLKITSILEWTNPNLYLGAKYYIDPLHVRGNAANLEDWTIGFLFTQFPEEKIYFVLSSRLAALPWCAEGLLRSPQDAVPIGERYPLKNNGRNTSLTFFRTSALVAPCETLRQSNHGILIPVRTSFDLRRRAGKTYNVST